MTLHDESVGDTVPLGEDWRNDGRSKDFVEAETYFALTDEGKAAVARDNRGLPLGYWLWSKEAWERYYRENPRVPYTPRYKEDRAAWIEYRKWEDQRFPADTAHPFKDPPGMAAARRAFEREQEISKAKEILRLRGASRVRR